MIRVKRLRYLDGQIRRECDRACSVVDRTSKRLPDSESPGPVISRLNNRIDPIRTSEGVFYSYPGAGFVIID